MSSLAELKALLAKMSDEERAAIVGELSPATAIIPVKPEVQAYSSQDAEGKITSIRIDVKSGKSRRPPLYVAPLTVYGLLSYADEVAIEAADASTQFPAGKLPEGNHSWEAAFTSLAESLAAPLAKWREQFAPAKKAAK